MIRVSLSVSAVALVALLLPPGSLAQQEPVVEPGAKLRLKTTLSSERLIGTLVEMSDDSYVLDAEGWNSPLLVPFASVTSLEVSPGQKSRAVEGAGIGLVIFGAAVAMSLGEHDVYDPTGGLVAVVLAVPVAGIGALIGYTFKTDRWEAVPLDRLRGGIVPQRGGGFAVGFSVRM